MYDYSKENVDEQCIKFFQKIWTELGVAHKVKAMFAGEIVNFSENKPALHMALRSEAQSFVVEGVNIMTEIHQVREKIKKFSHEVRDGKRMGITGKPIKTILNIGIGGSLLGVKSAYEGMIACEDVRQAK